MSFARALELIGALGSVGLGVTGSGCGNKIQARLKIVTSVS